MKVSKIEELSITRSEKSSQNVVTAACDSENAVGRRGGGAEFFVGHSGA